MANLLVLLLLFSFLGLVIGLINPKLVVRWSGRTTRRQVFLTYGLATAVMALFVLVTVVPSAKEQLEQDTDIVSFTEEPTGVAKEQEALLETETTITPKTTTTTSAITSTTTTTVKATSTTLKPGPTATTTTTTKPTSTTTTTTLKTTTTTSATTTTTVSRTKPAGHPQCGDEGSCHDPKS